MWILLLVFPMFSENSSISSNVIVMMLNGVYNIIFISSHVYVVVVTVVNRIGVLVA